MLYSELEEKIKELNKSIEDLKRYGLKLAQCEKEYKIKLNYHSLKLKKEDNMAVTLIDKVVYGVEEVATLREQRDIAQTQYESQKEYVNILKLQIRIIENQLQREYNNKYGN